MSSFHSKEEYNRGFKVFPSDFQNSADFHIVTFYIHFLFLYAHFHIFI